MDNEIWVVIIPALGSIFTAVVTACIQWLIEKERIKADIAIKQMDVDSKKEKVEVVQNGKQVGKTDSTKAVITKLQPKINWIFPISFAIVVGVAGYVYLFTRPILPESAIALPDANIEFTIKIDDRQIVIPVDGKGNAKVSLHAGDIVTIETSVTNANGDVYPNELAITYQLAVGNGNASHRILTYLVSQPDLITVTLEDQVTGDVVTRTLKIETER